MIPPPRMTRRFGTDSCASSPVESTQRRESRPGIGGRSGNEPVATIADLKATSSPPSTAIVFASLKRPAPFTHSTPFALKSEATPLVICLTTPAFHWFAVARSSSGSPTWTPSLPNVSCASLSDHAVCTQAFVGMQPTRRQVPPSSGSFSMQATLAPSCAARIAAVYPPGPPPSTAMSTSISLPRWLSGDANDAHSGRRRQAERLGRPRQRDLRLRERERPHPLAAEPVRRQAGVRTPVAGGEGDERLVARRRELTRVGPALGMDARQRRRELDRGVPDAGPVPVDQDRAAVAHAE